MIVYHGTTLIIQHPDTNHSKDFLDLGKGFSHHVCRTGRKVGLPKGNETA